MKGYNFFKSGNVEEAIAKRDLHKKQSSSLKGKGSIFNTNFNG